jgi:hypothetical protein
VVKRQARALLAIGGALSVAACGNILGLKDLEPYPSEGGTEEGGGDAQEESSADSPSMGDDTSMRDAHEATTTDAREEDGTVVGDAPQEVGSDVVTADSPPDTNPPPDSPTCGGGMVLCGGKCVDETGDGHNCGACGHDCLGGLCVASECKPSIYASSTDAWDIVVVNGTLYWVDLTSTVWTCGASATTCTPATLAGGQAQPTRITYDGSSCLFWTNEAGGTNGSIGSHQLGATSCPTVSGLGGPQGIAADANYIFWSDGAKNTVTRYARSGGATATTAVTMPGGVALVGATVYWQDDSMSRVMSSPEGNWTPAVAASAQSTPWAFGYDGAGNLYWVDYANPGAIWKTNGTTPTEIMGNQAMPIRVAADATTIYWANWGTNGSDGAVVSCDAAACTTTKTLASTLSQVDSLAMDSKAIYYGTVGDHRLWRLAR